MKHSRFDASVVTDARLEQAFFIVEPSEKQLVQVGDLLDAGKLRTTVDAVFPLAQAPDVFAGKVRRQGLGKLVVAVSANNRAV